MKFNYLGASYAYPSSLAEITLGQRIELHQLYGKAFEFDLKAIDEMEDGIEKSLNRSELELAFACQCFSFFTTISLDKVNSQFDLKQVLNVYNVSLALVLSEEQQVAVKSSYEFAGETWVIAQPELRHNSAMTFNEFVTSKEIVRQLSAFGTDGSLKSLQYLCAIYLRKTDEAFGEEMTDPDSERMKLMLNLPMEIALAVGFFLTDSINTYLANLQSFAKAEVLE